MSTKKYKNKSLSEKISESFIPRPLNDPEFDSEDDTAAKLVDVDEEDFEFGESSNVLSDFRKGNVKLLSERSDKYKGKISSRKELESDSHASSEQGEDSDEDDDGLKEYRNKLKNCQIDSEPDESLGTDEEAEEEEVAADSESEEDDSDYDSPGEDVSEESDDDHEQDVVGAEGILKETDKNADIQKGIAVQNQLKIWEKLLEVRIHSQKMMIKTNSLPTPDKYDKIAQESEEFSNLTKETQENVTKLLDKMVEMQTALSQQFSETKDLLRNSRKRQSTAPNEVPIKKFADLLQHNFETLRPYRNSVLQKWHDRTKILTPGSQGLKGRKSGSDNFDVVKKIETVLLNKSDLIKKSQQIKGNYQLFGQNIKQAEEQPMEDVEETQEVEEIKKENVCYPEIYDDTDFYHQQLRELIEFKTNTSTNPQEMSRQFAELQKLRQKMKKKVDTRASKGRKVRYVVHNKLVNFMAPHDPSEWTDDSKNELYRSLFAT